MAINIIGGILYFIGAYLIAKNNPLIRDFSKHITEQDIRREAFSLQGGIILAITGILLNKRIDVVLILSIFAIIISRIDFGATEIKTDINGITVSDRYANSNVIGYGLLLLIFALLGFISPLIVFFNKTLPNIIKRFGK